MSENWRVRRVASKDGDQGGTGEDGVTHRPILYYLFDNLDEVVSAKQYDGDGVIVTTTNGVPDAPTGGTLRAETDHHFDEQGRGKAQGEGTRDS